MWEVGYAVVDALKGVTIPQAMVPAAGPTAGAVMLNDAPVEVIDAPWLFAQGTSRAGERRPLCMLAGLHGGWLASFVRPMLEQAGLSHGDRRGRGRASGSDPDRRGGPVI